MSILEITAVVCALAYLLLAMKESVWCWLFGFYSVAIYVYICYQSKLYLETVLQVFYLFMSVYGYLQWIKGAKENDTLKITRWGRKRLLIILAFSVYVSIIVGYLFATYTRASMPYLDAPITVFSLVATYMVTKKYIENWIFWIVIDAASIYLYAARDLKLTAALYGLYVVLAILGYFEWKKKLAT